MATRKSTPSDSVIYVQNRSPTMLNELGMCAMQVRTDETRGEQNLLISACQRMPNILTTYDIV